MTESHSRKGSDLVHYLLLAVILLAALSFHAWMMYGRWRSQIGGIDFQNCIALGRQLTEFHSLPTFRYPGKTYGAPMKAFSLFWPTVFLGYREWIPPLMASLNITLICLGSYLVARQLFSRSAGLIAAGLTLASDPKIVGYVFRPAYGFDVILMLTLFVAAFAIGWAKRYRRDGSQPGVLYCFAMGLTAGVLWYIHPIASVPIAASGLFLVFSMGLRAFTWRMLLAGAAVILGSIRFWLYHLQFADARGSWISFGSKHPRTMSIPGILFSKKGLVWYTLSPSGNLFMRILFLLAILVLCFVSLRGLLKWMRTLKKEEFARFIREGLPLPIWTIGLFAFACMALFAIKTQGVSDASAGWNYHTELWFWYVIGLAFLLDLVRRRWSRVGLTIALVLIVGFAWKTSRRSEGSPEEDVRQWEEFKQDAADMLDKGFSEILTAHPRQYIYFSLGPSGLFISERHRAWVRPMAYVVERAKDPAVISELTPATLGGVRWDRTKLETIEIFHTFRMPQGGRALARGSWQVDVDGSPAPEMCDDDFSSLWWERRGDRGPETPVFSITLDQPRELCRVCFYIEWNEADWTYYTYPQRLKIEGRKPDGEWVTLTEDARSDGYFWESGRLYHSERERRRFDIRFEPEEIDKLRITDEGTWAVWRERKVSEMYLFEAGSPMPRDEDLQALLEWMSEKKPQRVLADRFVSAQAEAQDENCSVWHPPGMRLLPFVILREDDPWPWSPDLQPVQAGDVIVCELALAERVSRILESDGWLYDRSEFGYWTAFKVKGRQPESGPAVAVWNGFCLGIYPKKAAALHQLDRSRALYGEGNAEEAVEAALHALKLYPRYYEAGAWLSEMGAADKSEFSDWEYYAPPETALSEPVVFDDGTALIGYSVEPKRVAAGEHFQIIYYWKFPTPWKSLFNRPWVFCHFQRGEERLIDDHHLLFNYPNRLLRDVAWDEAFVSSRRVEIPEDFPAGEYEIKIGLHRGGIRLDVLSAGEDVERYGDNAVILPGFLVE